MKIYTKTGDKGETSMLGGKRVSKSCMEMDAIGEVDELNSWLGVLIEEVQDDFKKEARKLKGVQKCLFVVGAQLAALQMKSDNIKKIGNLEIKKLEKWIDEMEKDLPKLKNFISYSGSEEAVKSFFARAICRRAERVVIKLSKNYDISLPLKKYLNRLSDLLFVLGRWLNKRQNINDVDWGK